MMAFGGKKWKQLMKCSGWVKRILTIENNYERMATSFKFASLEEWVRIWRKNSYSVFKSENDDKKHHHELLRHSRTTKNRNVEPTMKRI